MTRARTYAAVTRYLSCRITAARPVAIAPYCIFFFAVFRAASFGGEAAPYLNFRSRRHSKCTLLGSSIVHISPIIFKVFMISSEEKFFFTPFNNTSCIVHRFAFITKNSGKQIRKIIIARQTSAFQPVTMFR